MLKLGFFKELILQNFFSSSKLFIVSKFKKKKIRKNKKVFIEPLEQRIMLDGAGSSTFLDLIDERSQSDN